ncbi:MAG: lysylphosphatidylglycerol synthase transmembrane domain-containing protein [Acidobacteriota bacterium]
MGSQSSGKATRHAFLLVLKIAVSASLLTLLLRRADLGGVARGLRGADPIWILAALGLYVFSIGVSAWRWQRLLSALDVRLPISKLFESFLVATFFNNFLPSNVGGDVIRIADTAKAAGSKTAATTVVLLDRGVGLLGLFLIAAIGATVSRWSSVDPGPVGATTLWAGLAAGTIVSVPVLMAPRIIHVLVNPVRRLHPEWIDERLDRLTTALIRFRQSPGTMLATFAGAVLVQAIMVLFYFALALSLDIRIDLPHLALLVPISFVVQMLPISINGLGVREAFFGLYFGRLGLPLHSALLLSLGGAAAVMLVSITGAGAYLARLKSHYRPPVAVDDLT